MSRPYTDITGQRFGNLTIIGEQHEFNKRRQRLWLAKCDCGAIVSDVASHFPHRKRCSRECPCIDRTKAGDVCGDFLVVSKENDGSYTVRCIKCGNTRRVHSARKLTRCKCNPLYNTKCSIEYNGEIMSRKALAEKIGISKQRLSQRIKRYGNNTLAYRPKGVLIKKCDEKVCIRKVCSKKELTDDKLMEKLKLKADGEVVYITRDICKQILKMIERIRNAE